MTIYPRPLPLYARSDASVRLRRVLASPDYRPEPLQIGDRVDPFAPVEPHGQAMVQVLELLLELQHPVQLDSRYPVSGALALLLCQLAAQELVQVSVRLLPEDSDAEIGTRLQQVSALRGQGIAAGVVLEEGLPGCWEARLEAVIEPSVDAQAQWLMLRTPSLTAAQRRQLGTQWRQEGRRGSWKQALSLLQQNHCNHCQHWGLACLPPALSMQHFKPAGLATQLGLF